MKPKVIKKKTWEKVDAKVTRTVIKNENGVTVGGYAEVMVRYGTQWRRLFFKLEER